MKARRAAAALPIPVRNALRKLGHDLRDARRRRRLPLAIVAQRASISQPTLIKLEAGDPGVAMGIYATVLFVLGLLAPLGDLADAKSDSRGRELEEERLPQRIRTKRASKPSEAP